MSQDVPVFSLIYLFFICSVFLSLCFFGFLIMCPFHVSLEFACVVLLDHPDHPQVPRAGRDKTHLPFSPWYNGIKIWLSEKSHLVSFKKSMRLAIRLALQPACIQGTSKQLLRLCQNLKRCHQNKERAGASWKVRYLLSKHPAQQLGAFSPLQVQVERSS